MNGPLILGALMLVSLFGGLCVVGACLIGWRAMLGVVAGVLVLVAFSGGAVWLINIGMAQR